MYRLESDFLEGCDDVPELWMVIFKFSGVLFAIVIGNTQAESARIELFVNASGSQNTSSLCGDPRTLAWSCARALASALVSASRIAFWRRRASALSESCCWARVLLALPPYPRYELIENERKFCVNSKLDEIHWMNVCVERLVAAIVRLKMPTLRVGVILVNYDISLRCNVACWTTQLPIEWATASRIRKLKKRWICAPVWGDVFVLKDIHTIVIKEND